MIPGRYITGSGGTIVQYKVSKRWDQRLSCQPNRTYSTVSQTDTHHITKKGGKRRSVEKMNRVFLRATSPSKFEVCMIDHRMIEDKYFDHMISRKKTNFNQ